MEITNKYAQAIMRYESARALVRNLSEKRKHLLSSCDVLKDCSGDYAYVRITVKTCLERAFNYLLKINEENSEVYTYQEALENMGTCDDDDYAECCDTCKESYEIKKGSLAKARQEFGESKRALIRLGKKLIKSERE